MNSRTRERAWDLILGFAWGILCALAAVAYVLWSSGAVFK
jgi:hypothetical protein